MKTLNLTDLKASDIKFEVSKFPDGQQQVTIDRDSLRLTWKGAFTGHIDSHVTIKARLKSFCDLELIACATASLREIFIDEAISSIRLYVPYFLGARSDRKFGDGSNNYLKDIICPIINSLGFASVTVLDPHSDVLEALITNFKKEDNLQLVNYALFSKLAYGETNTDKFVLVSPDAGALKKVYNIAEKIGYTGEIVIASKHRDLSTGKITDTSVYISNYVGDKDFVIIDDICDGGRTFIELAKAIKERKPNAKIYLIVTHGIFSNGVFSLTEELDGVYCTNSYKELGPEDWVFNPSTAKTFIHQLNIF